MNTGYVLRVFIANFSLFGPSYREMWRSVNVWITNYLNFNSYFFRIGQH